MRRRNRAFTIAEMVIVVTITAIMAAIAVPRMGSAQSRYQLDYAAKKVVADLDRARNNARVTGVSQLVTFNTSNHSYSVYTLPSVSTTYTVSLAYSPYNCRITSTSYFLNTMYFDVYGLPSGGGTIVLTGGGKTRTITISSSSGKASWQ